MIEAVIPCPEHGKMNEHCRQREVCMAKGRMTSIHYELHAASHHCPGGRRVRLVEVQPDYEAARIEIAAWFDEYRKSSEITAATWSAVDAAVPGPTYRVEEE